jgi:D-alanyl-D-alanine carboxypeptidase
LLPGEQSSQVEQLLEGLRPKHPSLAGQGVISHRPLGGDPDGISGGAWNGSRRVYRTSVAAQNSSAAWADSSVLIGLAVVAGIAVTIDRAVFSEETQTARPDLQRILDGLVTAPSRITPGVTAYVSGPHGTWTGAAGVANVKSSEPMRPDARMRLESGGKLWTATLVLRLAQQHKLSLDDTVEHWLPNLLPYGSRVNLRQLLNHTSGMIDSNNIIQHPDLYLHQIKDQALRAKIIAVVKKSQKDPGYEFSRRLWVQFAGAIPLLLPPGSAYHYSNIGYIVAGLVAERAGGQALPALFDREIISPLRLASAAYDPHSRISGPHAHGYQVAANGKLTDATTWTNGLGANGGIVSDAADEARFLTALMQGKLLKPEQLAALKKPSNHSNYGLGTGIVKSGCAGTAYGHNGGGAGFETNVFISGNGNRVAVLLLNGRTIDNSGDGIAYKAMNKLYCAA